LDPKLELSTVCCLSTHNNTQVLHRTGLGLAPPKVGQARWQLVKEILTTQMDSVDNKENKGKQSHG